jgi:hypothetical protein
VWISGKPGVTREALPTMEQKIKRCDPEAEQRGRRERLPICGEALDFGLTLATVGWGSLVG